MVADLKKEIYPLTYTLEDEHWWYVGRRKIILTQLASILESRNKPREGLRILDYGCGTGINLVHFAKLGDVFGLDVSETAIHFCQKRGIANVMKVHPGDPPQENPFGQKFDFITLLDVLEHLPDDGLALARISRWLAPGGYLLVTVPAFEFLWSGEDYVSNHLRRYTRNSLAKAFQQAGIEVTKITYFNFSLFAIQAAVILWNRVVHPRRMYETNLKLLSTGLNSSLKSIFSSEAKFLQKHHFPIGGSILCVGQAVS